MRLTICDRQGRVAEAARALAGRLSDRVEGVTADLLSLRADAAVSPANSFGYMDGGIDLAYSRKWGRGVQERLQAEIAKRPMGELLVGEALVIETGDAAIPFMISAPTMRVPRPIANVDDVYLASRAAFLAARERGFGHVLMPGMGTLTGRVPAWTAVELMLLAYRHVFSA